MSEHESTETGHEAHGEHGSIKTYLAVFVALVVLTGASFMTYFDFWDNNISPHVAWAFMMAVSCSKALLVVLFFMHLKWEANWKYVLTIPAAFMSMFLILMLVPDVGMRIDNRLYGYSPERWQYAATPEETHGEHASDDDASHVKGEADH